MRWNKACFYTFITFIVILTMTLTPLKSALAAPEPAPPQLGILTVGAIVGLAFLGKSMVSDLISGAGDEAQDTLREAERILDELIAKIRENFEGALDVTLDELDAFSRNQLELIHGLIQDILIELELGFEDLNETILEDIEFISLELEARIAQLQDIAVVVVRGTILIIDKATFNLAFVVDLIIFAVGLLVFIILFFTRRIPTEPLSRRLALGGIALFMAIFGFFLLPHGRAFALTFTGFGERIQALERPDIFQIRPDTLIIGETEEVIVVGTRLAPQGQPPTVEIAGKEIPSVISNELVALQVAGIDFSDSLGSRTITLRTPDGVDTALIRILAAPPPPPDLVISNFRISPSAPVVDQNAQARIEVSNQGEGTASGFRVRWKPTAALSGQVIEVNGLGVGESEEVVFNFTYIRSGQFQTVAIVDPFNEVDESEEANNTKTRSVTVLGDEIQPTLVRTPPGQSCEDACQASRDLCMQDGELLPRQCVQIYQACVARCP